MLFVSPYPLLQSWLDHHAAAGPDDIVCTLDDLIDILRGIIIGIPVDEAFYARTNPAVARGRTSSGYGTLREHYYKHGYFEDRQPFEAGWQGLKPPMPFAGILKTVAVMPALGRLDVKFGCRTLMETICKLLQSVPVNEQWYFDSYPEAKQTVRLGHFESAADHYCRKGYFDAHLPQPVTVDEAWYLSRYEHARHGLAAGHAATAQQHFLRMGYAEGCAPVQP